MKAVHRPDIAILSLLFFICSACTRTMDLQAVLPTETKGLPIIATLALIKTTITLPSPTDTPTVTPCEPDWCIEQIQFLLERPIQPPGNDRIDPIYPFASTQFGTREPHSGVEFNNPTGTIVVASADGEVFYSGNDHVQAFNIRTDFYGNLIILKHNLPGFQEPIYTLYGHLSEINVLTGQQVVKGQPIGKVGMTGSADGSHLHFEVRLDTPDYKSVRNPAIYLEPRKLDSKSNTGLILGQVLDALGNPVRTDIEIQRLPDEIHESAQFTPEVYYPSMRSDEKWKETFSLDDVVPGNYRLVAYYLGTRHEIFFQVKSSEMTFVHYQFPK